MQPLDELDGNDIGFLSLAATGVVAAAVLAAGWQPRALLIAAPGIAAFVFQGRLARLPVELRAALIMVPLFVAVRQQPDYHVLLFISVTAVLYLTVSTTAVRAGVIAGAAAVAMPFVEWWSGSDELGWTSWVFAHLFVYVLALVVLRQQRLIAELDAAREELARRAVNDERRRIARELHDLAGHTLAAVLLHVTGARHVLRRDLDEADAALRDAEAVGRDSLDQIRHVVAELRTDESGTDPALATGTELRPLVDEYRRAGLAVDTAIDPAATDIGGPTGTALHRIAREALANVARHAPDNRVLLTVGREGGDVVLDVVDRGRPSDAARSAGDPTTHFGLIGMQERARALGGRLDAAPTNDGWAVRARLPLTDPTPAVDHRVGR